MRKYTYNGKSITAATREEAIAYFAGKKTKVTASSGLDDDIYEEYGNEYLMDKDSDYALFDMSELDEQLGSMSPSEAIEQAYYGFDFDGKNHNGGSQFNPNEDYFSYSGNGNLVSIRSVYKVEWLKGSIDEDYFIDWLKDNHKDAIEDILRDEVEAEIEKVINSGKMFGFDSKKMGYAEVMFDRDSDELTWHDVSVTYDYDESLDWNIENLHDEIESEHPDAFDEDDENEE